MMSFVIAALRTMRNGCFRSAVLGMLVCLLGMPDIGNAGVEEELLGAAEKGNIGTVRSLLNEGADPNSCMQGILNPLTAASMNGRLDIVTGC